MGIGYAIGTLVLALVHVLGGHLNLEDFPHHRRWISVVAGVSVAYVFVDLLPLMSEEREAFLAVAEGRRLVAPEFRVHIAALVGFLWFYGLDHFVGSRQETPSIAEEAAAEPSAQPVHWLHVGGFALYNLMIGYLLIEWSEKPVSLALYCGALGLHFLITDDGMRRGYGAMYDRVVRWLMATCIVAGALVAGFAPLSIGVLTTVVGVVAGGVVINSVKDEMPSAGGGRFLPSVVGALAYATLIMVASRLEAG